MYLNSQKEYLKRLVAELSRQFAYVSVLGTDVCGKQYLVQKKAVGVSDSRWVERGFVVRVYNGKFYTEYSFNEFPPGETPEQFAREIGKRLNQSCFANDSEFVDATYPLLEETELRKSFDFEVAVLPETVSAREKLARMTAIKEQALRISGLLVDFKVRYEEVTVSKIFISTRRELEQAYVWSQGYLIPMVRRGDRTKLVYRAFSGLKGPELLDEMNQEIVPVIRRAERLLDAGRMIPGEYEVICTPEIAGLIAHEAFGHGVEMDMFVKHRAKALEYLGKPVASQLVTMHDGAAAAMQVSSYGFDDEGVLASDTRVIDHGILQTGISDILSALRLQQKPTGNGKRESFERKAYARMTNTFFSPGTDRLDEMIASVRHGYLLDGYTSGMEDPKNWGIQCMLLQGEEIRDGRLTGNVVSPVVMTGYVPDLLGDITMISADLALFGSGACGKGHKEWAKVSDGGPYIKTRARLG